MSQEEGKTYEQIVHDFASKLSKEELFDLIKGLADRRSPAVLDLIPYFMSAKPKAVARPWWEIISDEDR